jgi:poly(A) polymerase
MPDLTPIKTIPLQSWMSAPETQAVMTALNQDAVAPQALFVGGCVRNALLDLPVTDIDIATKYTPDKAAEILKRADIKTIPTGIDHGTITAIIGERSYEITTLRRDVSTDGRHAEVVFSQSWHEDAERRDFTMNTLLADEKGNIYDPLGQGLSDLLARKVIFVGKAEDRIQEDILRILRFFRFFAYYGAGEPDHAALKACEKFAGRISGLSKERITQEFMKILAASNAPQILSLMAQHNILPDLTNAAKSATFKNLCQRQTDHSAEDIIARLLGLDVDDKAIETYLILTNKQKAHLKKLRNMASITPFTNDRAIKEAIYYHGRGTVLQTALMQDAITTDQITLIQQWTIPTFPTTGADLIAQGYTQGPDLGQELARLEKEWLARQLDS